MLIEKPNMCVNLAFLLLFPRGWATGTLFLPDCNSQRFCYEVVGRQW